jgi:ATPase subunit of ABC transporter with duplicated ATPase domains
MDRPGGAHRRVCIGALDQTRLGFDGASAMLDAFVAQSGLAQQDARSLLAKFGLEGDAVARPAPSLSPGERTRASLALLMASGANWLVLDEPTTHLDLPAIEQLETALNAFDGTLLLVTHDRQLLEAVALDRTVSLDAGAATGGS